MANIITHTENLNRYFNDIRGFQPLSYEEEKNLYAEYKRGNTEARDAICNPNLRWIVNRAKSYTSNPEKVQDLIQEGSMGMLDAFERFDPAKGYKFFSYANYYIDLYMRRFLFGDTLVRQSNEIKIAPRVRKIVNQFFALNERYPNEYEICDILESEYGIEVNDIRDVFPMGFSSMDMAVEDGEDDRVCGEYGKIAERTATSNEYEDISEIEGLGEDLKKYLRKLTAKELSVIGKSFGLNGGVAMADEDIAEEMGLTKERVRQIKVGAIRKMGATA